MKQSTQNAVATRSVSHGLSCRTSAPSGSETSPGDVAPAAGLLICPFPVLRRPTSPAVSGKAAARGRIY